MRRMPARGVMLGLMLALLLGGCGGGEEAPAVESQPVARTGVVQEQIDVGGRALYLECSGGTDEDGAPTVILDAGLGGSTGSWNVLRSLLPGSVRACAYDRAGLGGSDPAPAGPRTAADLAADLDLLLRAAEIEPPYVMVAHSLGPWVSLLYAAEHPGDVQGMVLVDPRAPQVTAAWLADAQAAAAADPAAKEMVDAMQAFASDPSTNDEGLDVAGSEKELLDALGGDEPLLGDAPLVVLAGERTSDDFPPVVRAAWTRSWRTSMRSLLDLSSAARLVPVDTGHMIPDEAPAAIVDAIGSTLDGG